MSLLERGSIVIRNEAREDPTSEELQFMLEVERFNSSLENAKIRKSERVSSAQLRIAHREENKLRSEKENRRLGSGGPIGEAAAESF